MTQRELDDAISLVTGEDLREIRRRGFSIAISQEDWWDSEASLPQTVDWDAVDFDRRSTFV